LKRVDFIKSEFIFCSTKQEIGAPRQIAETGPKTVETMFISKNAFFVGQG